MEGKGSESLAKIIPIRKGDRTIVIPDQTVEVHNLEPERRHSERFKDAVAPAGYDPGALYRRERTESEAVTGNPVSMVEAERSRALSSYIGRSLQEVTLSHLKLSELYDKRQNQRGVLKMLGRISDRYQSRGDKAMELEGKVYRLRHASKELSAGNEAPALEALEVDILEGINSIMGFRSAVAVKAYDKKERVINSGIEILRKYNPEKASELSRSLNKKLGRHQE